MVSVLDKARNRRKKTLLKTVFYYLQSDFRRAAAAAGGGGQCRVLLNVLGILANGDGGEDDLVLGRRRSETDIYKSHCFFYLLLWLRKTFLPSKNFLKYSMIMAEGCIPGNWKLKK